MAVTAAFIHSLYVGINVQNILYGIELVLYFMTLQVLLGDKGAHRKFNLSYALFSTMMAFLVTTWVTAQVTFGKKMWIEHSDYPGGAAAYWDANIDVWYMDLAAVAVIVLQLMTDGLMIHRCRIIWNSYRVVLVPIVLWFATLILGILVAWLSSAPGSDFYSGITAHFSLAYWSVSVFLHTTLTCMICYRVIRYGRAMRECLGQEHASIYFAVATTVVESVLPYTLSGIAFIVALGTNSSSSTALIRVYFLMMCISPQMLILQVVSGNAWRSDTFTLPRSTIRFGRGDSDMYGSGWSDSSATEIPTRVSCLQEGHGDVKIAQV